MSIIGNNILAGASGQRYEIKRSLRFNGDTAYLNKDFSSDGNRQAWTWSAWVKRSDVGTDRRVLFGGYGATNNTDWLEIGYKDNGVYATINTVLTTGTYLFRDPSAWYHYLVNYNGAYVKWYINGDEVHSWARTGNLGINGGHSHTIGKSPLSTITRYHDGYLAEVNFIDGQTLDGSSFGKTDPVTGAWIPKKYSGSYGTNGFYLSLSDNSDITATTLGKDSSGNGNNWTPANFSVSAGAGNDSLEDTPTTNWCTLNPLITHNGTAGSYEEGNLRRKNSTDNLFAPGFSSIAVTSGKWYFECSGDTSIYVQVGFVDATQIASVTSGAGFFNPTRGWGYQSNGAIKGNNTTYVDNTPVAASTSGDIIGCAVDFDSGSAEWYVNGSQTGATLDFSSYLATGRAWHLGVAVTNDGTDVVDVNFGQRAFDISSIPTGFKALNTANLPVPTIKNGTEYFTPVLYTGNVTARDITVTDNQDVAWQPDWVWIKGRTTTSSHVLTDSVRGATKILSSHNTNAESTDADTLTSFNSDGFSIGADVKVNTNNHTYVAWNWKAGGSGSANTDGTISSTVSVNADAGFSIVSYTSNGTSGATVGHGLGIAPAMYMVKMRTSQTVGTDNWAVFHKSLGATKNLWLDATNTQNTSATYWNNTEPTSSVFSLGNDLDVNHSNSYDYIAYCFAEVEGYSKFGSYTGNGSSGDSGPFVALPFRPAFLLIKSSATTAANWAMLDNTRNPFNVVNDQLFANLGNGEFQNYTFGDLLSNGFKIRDNSSGLQANYNNSGVTYVYMAFAETPFKYANAA